MLFWIVLYFSVFIFGGAIAGPFIGLGGPWIPSSFAPVWLGAMAGGMMSVMWPVFVAEVLMDTLAGRP